MDVEEMREELNRRKNEEINPFGLIRKTIHFEETSTLTEFDSFILEDSLRYLEIQNRLAEIKEKLKGRLDPKTGLYRVTVGDVNSELFGILTMFNRISSNKEYFRKVSYNLRLFDALKSGIISKIRKEMEDAIDEIDSNSMDDDSVVFYRH